MVKDKNIFKNENIFFGFTMIYWLIYICLNFFIAIFDNLFLHVNLPIVTLVDIYAHVSIKYCFVIYLFIVFSGILYFVFNRRTPTKEGDKQ